MSVDYDHELGNGWGKWENLVLQGLKDQKEDIKDLKDDVADVKIDVALVRQKMQVTEDYGKRLVALETNSVTNTTLKHERRWLVGTAVAIIGSIIIPIGLALTFGGGGV